MPPRSCCRPGPYRVTSPMRKRLPLGLYRRPMPRVLGGSQGGVRFLVGEAPLYAVLPLATGCRLPQKPRNTRGSHWELAANFQRKSLHTIQDRLKKTFLNYKSIDSSKPTRADLYATNCWTLLRVQNPCNRTCPSCCCCRAAVLVGLFRGAVCWICCPEIWSRF